MHLDTLEIRSKIEQRLEVSFEYDNLRKCCGMVKCKFAPIRNGYRQVIA